MPILHKALRDALGELPEQLFAQMLSQKLQAYGVKLSRAEYGQLQHGILSGEPRILHLRRWRWWERERVVLEFIEEKAPETAPRCPEILGHLPQLIEELSRDSAIDVLAALKQGWQGELRRQRREKAGFERRLARRWGEPLALLRMLLTIAQEYGASITQELRESSTASPYLVEALTRLHARACQVVHEILVLLAAGLADGAMARWRTLHEIAAIALFIGEHGEALAERYVLHQHVESRRAALDYIACQERLGYEPLEPGEIEAVEQLYVHLLERFGHSFGTLYGWAAEQLGIKKPAFDRIERAAGIDHLRVHYRMASHNVHANHKGVFLKLGLLNEVDCLLAGPGNAGLADPGHSAAISLVQTSTPLGLLHPTFDNIVALQIMVFLEKEIGQAFADAHQQMPGHDAT